MAIIDAIATSGGLIDIITNYLSFSDKHIFPRVSKDLCEKRKQIPKQCHAIIYGDICHVNKRIQEDSTFSDGQRSIAVQERLDKFPNIHYNVDSICHLLKDDDRFIIHGHVSSVDLLCSNSFHQYIFISDVCQYTATVFIDNGHIDEITIYNCNTTIIFLLRLRSVSSIILRNFSGHKNSSFRPVKYLLKYEGKSNEN